MTARARWMLVVTFAAGMAWVEAACVYYLRVMVDRVEPYQPDPLPIRGILGEVELVREGATLLMLAMISLYRLPDFVMGPMANPFYADLGIDKETVGAVRGSVGLIASITGIAAAGLFALRFGFIATLLVGAILVLLVARLAAGLCAIWLPFWIYGVVDAWARADAYNRALRATGRPPW